MRPWRSYRAAKASGSPTSTSGIRSSSAWCRYFRLSSATLLFYETLAGRAVCPASGVEAGLERLYIAVAEKLPSTHASGGEHRTRSRAGAPRFGDSGLGIAPPHRWGHLVALP